MNVLFESTLIRESQPCAPSRDRLRDGPRNGALVGHTNDEAVFSSEVAHIRGAGFGLQVRGRTGGALSPPLRAAALSRSAMPAAALARAPSALTRLSRTVAMALLLVPSMLGALTRAMPRSLTCVTESRLTR